MFHQSSDATALPGSHKPIEANSFLDQNQTLAAETTPKHYAGISGISPNLATINPVSGGGTGSSGTNGGGDETKQLHQQDRYKCEIRVYKKSSLNGKITVYIGKRDFVDHIDHVDPIDGVVLIDRDYLGDRKVFGHVLATFSYGRDDLDVLGLTFRKELYLVSEQIFPDSSRIHQSADCPYFIDGLTNIPSYRSVDNSISQNNLTTDASNALDNKNDSDGDKQSQHSTSLAAGGNTGGIFEATTSLCSDSHPGAQQLPMRPLTRLQERLVRKLGKNAFPFYFELPPMCPSSVTLQPGPGENGKPCGVDYELKAYIANSLEEKPSKHDSIRLAIRKIMYAPSKQGEQPMVEVSKDFMMSPNKLNLEVSLDKSLYHHGESIAVNVHVSNNSNRTVKKVKVSFRQFADICLFSTAQYKCTVAEIDSEDGCPVGPGSTLSKVYYLRPLLADNKDKRGLALDGQLKHEDTNLASSTLLTDSSQKENLGIVVQYKVRVKLSLGPLGGDIHAELPVTLMHPKPVASDLDQAQIFKNGNEFGHKTICRCNRPSSEQESNCEIVYPDGEAGGRQSQRHQQLSDQHQSEQVTTAPLNSQASSQGEQEHDLIQLDDENDIIFEDFARLKLDANDLSCSNKSSSDGFHHYLQSGSVCAGALADEDIAYSSNQQQANNCTPGNKSEVDQILQLQSNQ